MIISFSEIASSLKRNKLRTALTGFSIAWGIFMLIILLAAGNGLKNGVTSNFANDNVNQVSIWAGWTSIPYKGKPKYTRIKMDNSDSVMMANVFSEVDQVIPIYRVGYKQVQTQNYFTSTNIQAVIPAYFNMEPIDILQGRNLNQMDVELHRKVVVLAERDAKSLFKGENAINQFIFMDNIVYQVVGVYKTKSSWRTDAFIPLSTAQKIYNNGNRLEEMIITVNGLTTEQANEEFNDRIRKQMSLKHEFDPQDRRAVYIWNQLENYLQSQKIFSAITLFVWIIGIGTLIAGIVGVSNIMLVTVRERTKEFGIRKALGAKPSSIIRMIIAESLVVTALFGYIGMVFGIVVTEAINKMMSGSMGMGDEGPTMFKNPTVDLGIVVAATLVLIVAGILAGYFPARKAVKIKPIEALRSE